MEKTFGIHCFTKTEGVEVRMGWEDFGEKVEEIVPHLVGSSGRERIFRSFDRLQ